nr:hypothetical protein [Tanacetum cinerariifolium]
MMAAGWGSRGCNGDEGGDSGGDCGDGVVVRWLWWRWGGGGGYGDGSCGGCSGGFGGGGWSVVESDMVDIIDRVMGSLFGFAGNARRKVFWRRPEVVAVVAGWPAVGR